MSADPIKVRFFNNFLPTGHGPVPKLGKISLFALPSRASTFATTAEELAYVADVIDADEDLYFGVALRRPDFSGPGRGTINDIIGCRCFWIDIDVQDPTHRAQNLPPDEESAARLIDSVYPDMCPTVVISSGHGLHAYWIFDEVVPLASTRDREFYQQSVKDFQQRFINRAQEDHGWHVDHTHDLARVLRVPGRMNRKDPSNPRPVTVLYDEGPIYPASDFVRITGGPTEAPAPALPEPEDRPFIPVDFDKLREDLLNSTNPATRDKFTQIFAGESFSPPGRRDQDMQSAAGAIAAFAPDGNPIELAEVLRPSLAVWAGEANATLSLEDELIKAIDKIARAQKKQHQKRLAEDATHESARKAFQKSLSEPNHVQPWTPDEIQQIASRHGYTLKELQERWAIHINDTYFVLEPIEGDELAKYTGPWNGRQIELHFQRWLKRAPVDLFYETENGAKPKNIKQLLIEYSRPALKIKASLIKQYSSFNEKEKVFTFAATPRRKLQPCFNSDIAEWLNALGGDDKEKFLDWLATITRLEHYTCALYLAGPPNVGKSLLVNGLARIWSGIPTPLNSAFSNFNDAILNCPVVVAEEEIDRDGWGQHRSSASLRRFLGTPSFSINKKFHAPMEMEGAPRLILTGNNTNMLQFNEAMSKEDMEAMTERFLYIDCAQAKGFFKRFPLERAPASWANDGQDLIARHVLWLAQERQVTAPGRYLVTGNSDKIHSMIATSGVSNDLVEWLARFLSASNEVRRQVLALRTMSVGNGELRISLTTVLQHWDKFGSKQPPTLKRLSSMVRPIGEPIKTTWARYWRIKHEQVLKWMDDNGIGDPDAARKLIETPIPTLVEDSATGATGATVTKLPPK